MLALLLASQLPSPAHCQQMPSPGVIAGPYGVPISLQSDTGEWEVPIQVFDAPGTRVYVPDFTGPSWAAWHIQRFDAHNFSYFIDVYTYYAASRQTAVELIFVDTRKSDQVVVQTMFGRTLMHLAKNSAPAKIVAKITALLRPEAERLPAETAEIQNYLQRQRDMTADEIANTGKPPTGLTPPASTTIQPPRLLSAVDPQWTPAARRAKLNGTVVISVLVNVDGEPQDVKVVKSLGLGLDEEAVRAVRQYHFAPAVNRVTSEAVPFRINVEVHFRIY